MGSFDLEEQFAFYGAYHTNMVNIFIHFLFVWPIYYTGFVLLYFVPFNIGFFVAAMLSIFYISWDKKAGSLTAVLCFLCWFGASALASRLGYSVAWKVVLASQLFCWTFQLVGHLVFEKRAPALMDNLSQAGLMAPFFVVLEALHLSFGYEPYPGFSKSVKAQADANIKIWEESKQKKLS